MTVVKDCLSRVSTGRQHTIKERKGKKKNNVLKNIAWPSFERKHWRNPEREKPLLYLSTSSNQRLRGCVRRRLNFYTDTGSWQIPYTKRSITNVDLLDRVHTKMETWKRSCFAPDTAIVHRYDYNAENDHRKRSHSKALSRVERFENDAFWKCCFLV